MDLSRRCGRSLSKLNLLWLCLAGLADASGTIIADVEVRSFGGIDVLFVVDLCQLDLLLYYLTQSNALLFHSKYNPTLKKNTTNLNPQRASKLEEGLNTIGRTSTNSTSKITNTTAKIKNRNDTGERVSFILLKPHSRGDKYSRERASYLEKTKPSAKNSKLRVALTRNRVPQKKIY